MKQPQAIAMNLTGSNQLGPHASKCPLDEGTPPEQIYVSLSTTWYVFLALITSLGLLVSLISNMIIIYLFTRTPSLRRSPSNIVAVNLSLSDLLYCTQWPSVIYCSITQSTWILESDFICKSFGFISVSTGLASILTVTIMSIERAAVIIYSIHAKNRFTIRTAWLTIVFIWILSICVAVPPLFGRFNRYTLDLSKTSCTLDYLSNQADYKLYILALYVAFWILPTIIISICYILIIATFKRSSLSLREINASDSRRPSLAEPQAAHMNESFVIGSCKLARRKIRDSIRRHNFVVPKFRRHSRPDRAAGNESAGSSGCHQDSPPAVYHIELDQAGWRAATHSIDSLDSSNNCRTSPTTASTSTLAAHQSGALSRLRRSSFRHSSSSSGSAPVAPRTAPTPIDLSKLKRNQKRRLQLGARPVDGCEPPGTCTWCRRGPEPSRQLHHHHHQRRARADEPLRRRGSIRADRRPCRISRPIRSKTLDSIEQSRQQEQHHHQQARSDPRLGARESRASGPAADGPNKWAGASINARAGSAKIVTSDGLARWAELMPANRVSQHNSGPQLSRTVIQFRLAKMSFYLILLWLVSWTPIASLGMINSVLECHRVSATAVFMAITMTKLGPAFDVFIYGISHPKIKSKFKQIIKWLFMMGHNNAGPQSGCRPQRQRIKTFESVERMPFKLKQIGPNAPVGGSARAGPTVAAAVSQCCGQAIARDTRRASCASSVLAANVARA